MSKVNVRECNSCGFISLHPIRWCSNCGAELRLTQYEHDEWRERSKAFAEKTGYSQDKARFDGITGNPYLSKK